MRRDANMSKRRFTSIAIATLCLITMGIPPHLAEKSVGATLSERFSSLGGMFKKDDPKPQSNRSQANRSQASQSSTRSTRQRSARTGYGKTSQRGRTTASNNSRSRTSSPKKSGLSSFLPESLFGKKKTSQNVASDRPRQQPNRQQQASSRSQNRRSAGQVAQQKRSAPSAKVKSQIAKDLPEIVEDRRAPIAATIRRSPQIGRDDDLQDTLDELGSSDDLLPGSVIVDSEETVVEDNVTPAPGAAVLAMDDYGAEIVGDTDDVAEFEDTAIAEDEAALVVEDEYIAEEVVVSEQTPDADESLKDETFEIVGNLPLTGENLDSQEAVQDYSVDSHDDAEFAVVQEEIIYEPSQQIADNTFEENNLEENTVEEGAAQHGNLAQEETPFGQANLDVHDALLSEDLYAMPEEEAAVVSEQEPAMEEGHAEEQFADIVETLEKESAEIALIDEPHADELAPAEVLAEQPELAAEELVAGNTAEEAFATDSVTKQESALTDELYYSATEPQEASDPQETLAEPQNEEEAQMAVVEITPQADQPVPSVDAFESISELASESTPEPQQVIASDSQSSPGRYSEHTPTTTVQEPQQQSGDQFADVVETLESQPRLTATNPVETPKQGRTSQERIEVVASEPIKKPEPQQQLVREDIKTASQPQPREATRLIRPHGDVLTSAEQPVIMSHVEGPRSILVGKEASYRVVLENTSQAEAQNLSAAVKVPEWADLVDVVCSAGIVEQSRDGKNADTLQWHLPKLGAHSSQTLQLQLIPRSGRAFQLGVQWSQETATTETIVEVKEPKLQMAIEGPEDVLFGDPKRYRLVLKNPGNGPAENVALTLIPPGSDSLSAKPHVIGTLGPSEVKEIEIELTARETGELILQASAEATGDLKCEVIKRVQCRKPELEVDWRGPEQKYAGTESAYYFRVHNPGTARTGVVDVKVRLPAGIKFISASDSFSYDATSGLVTWRLDGLRPTEEQFMQFRCELERPGLKEFEVEATSQGGLLTDAEWIRTEVIALADLKLDVRDPRGAHPTGEPVTYEIRVENRGTTDAEGISIVGLFSEGIDPVSVEGAQSSVRDGRVNFQTVKTLPPGGEILLKIRAIASDVGTHIFRAEVSCHDLDIKLAAEETTRFFKDDFQWGEGETPYTAARIKKTSSR